MINDGVLVALIKESVTAEAHARRLAAQVLVETLRSGQDAGEKLVNGFEQERIIVPSDIALAVADEMRNLIERYELSGRKE